MDDDAVVIGGTGYVGKATALAFGVKKIFQRHGATVTLEEASKCHFAYICLPTPTVGGKCDTSLIYEIIKQMESYPRYADTCYVIRSTVYPGFADHVMNSLNMERVISNPEFLSENTWEEDTKHPKMIVIGGRSLKYLERVKGIYMGRYKYSKPLITDNITAEMVKYYFNTWFATKTIFSNEIFNACQKNGANYETLKLAGENHPWGMKNHNQIVYKGRRGVHGSCLPKDTEAFAEYSQSPFFKMLVERNKTYQ